MRPTTALDDKVIDLNAVLHPGMVTPQACTDVLHAHLGDLSRAAGTPGPTPP